jgi:hypothetical protein
MTGFKVGDKVRVSAGGSCYFGLSGVVIEVCIQRYETRIIVNLDQYKGCVFLPTSLQII